jgi:hypothetical protein
VTEFKVEVANDDITMMFMVSKLEAKKLRVKFKAVHLNRKVEAKYLGRKIEAKQLSTKFEAKKTILRLRRCL